MTDFGPAEIRRILDVVDDLGLHREAVVVPLDTEPGGRVELESPGRIRIVAPPSGFEEWLAELRGRITGLDLSAVPRAEL